MEIYIL